MSDAQPTPEEWAEMQANFEDSSILAYVHELRAELQKEIYRGAVDYRAHTLEIDQLRPELDEQYRQTERLKCEVERLTAERDAALEKSAFWHRCYMDAMSKRFEGTGL